MIIRREPPPQRVSSATPRRPVSRGLILAALIGAVVVVVALGVGRFLDSRADGEFRMHALRVTKMTWPIRYERQGEEYREVPSSELSSKIEEARNVFAEARIAALGVRTREKRELALRWLDAREELARAKAAVGSHFIENFYLSPCGLPLMKDLALAVRQGLTPSLREVWDACRRLDQTEIKPERRKLDAEVNRLTAHANDLWAKLVALAPAIGP